MPPAIWNERSEMPSFSSRKPPPMMNRTSTANDAATATMATLRRTAASKPAVTARKTGSAAIGLTTMNSVTNSLRRSCHMAAPRIVEDHEVLDRRSAIRKAMIPSVKTGGDVMDQRIISLYDRFTHGGISRREFLDRLTELAGSAAAGAALLPLLQNDYAQAAIVADNDARLATERLAYDSPKGRINGYLARGKDKGKRPVVLVIHENRGLNPHLEDVARRFALEGFLAYAVDLLSLVGGTPRARTRRARCIRR